MKKTKQPTDRKEIFENYPVKKAVFTLALPAALNQLVTTLYNLTDTFFIGKTNNSDMVSAVAVGSTIMILTNCIGSLFGMGGGSLISRCLGAGDRERAKRISSFCAITTIICAGIFGLSICFNLEWFAYFVGADKYNIAYTMKYLFYTMGIGALPTALAMALGAQLRAEGCGRYEMIGMVSGHLINFVMDPIFIFVLKLNVAGAAIATMVSNVLACLYYIYYIRKNKNSTVINFKLSNYKIDFATLSDILLVGLPAAFNSIINSASRVVLNNLLKVYGSAAVAAMGIVQRIDELPMHLASGFTQGSMALIGYNYASKNYKRMEEIRKYSFGISFMISASLTVLIEIFAPYIMRMFVNDVAIVSVGIVFLRIMATCLPVMCLNFALRSVFQAIGKGPRALIVTFLRQGVIYIPVMIILSKFNNANYIAAAQFLADSISLVIAYLMYIPVRKKLLSEEKLIQPSVNPQD